MNFFQHQEMAKANSKKLIWLFAFLLVFILCFIEGSIYFIFHWLGNIRHEPAGIPLGQADPSLYVFRNQVMWVSGGLAVFTIGVSTAYELWQTKKLGGKHIAALVGATKLEKGSGTFLEERFLNIVEEMAIAASIPVPSAWVLKKESSINAFAAGWSLQDAVICVNQGTLDYLSREELQGVIAHEISHIVHSDMNLNLKASSLIFGLTSLEVLGTWFWKTGSKSRSSNSSNSNGSAIYLFILLTSVIFMILGFLGAFAGNIIRSAISRQREFLADSSAVQYTRNPTGIGGALRKIEYISTHGNPYMSTVHSMNISHMCLSPSQRKSFFWPNALASHPPLPERIERILGRHLSPLKALEKQAVPKEDLQKEQALLDLPIPFVVGMQEAAPLNAVSGISSLSADSAKTPAQPFVHTLEIPLDSAKDAQILAFALMYCGSEKTFSKHLESYLTEQCSEEEVQKIINLQATLAPLKPLDLLLLAERTFVWLKNLSDLEKKNFLHILNKLSQLDKRIQTYERCLLEHYQRRLTQTGIPNHSFGKRSFVQEEKHIAQSIFWILSLAHKDQFPEKIKSLVQKPGYAFLVKHSDMQTSLENFKFKNLYFLETLNSTAKAKFIKLMIGAIDDKINNNTVQLLLLLCCAIMSVPFDVLSESSHRELS